jgi:hypothetical protein
VGSAVIVAGVPGPQGGAALGGGSERLGVDPFAEAGLDEAFGFAVGARCIGSGAEVAPAGGADRGGEIARAIGIAVVGHDAFDRDPMGREEPEGSS